MRLVDEFRAPAAARALAARIARAVDEAGRPVRLMEVCGGHTMAIHRFGIPELLPEAIELISGPGCPVCVTPTAYIDRALELAGRPEVTLATFGDLYRVPGGGGSLEDAAAGGADVRVVYSARDALKLAVREPEREVIFLAIGFETTAPGTAATLLEGAEQGVGNFRVMSGHKTMPEALRALTEGGEAALDGFLLPGHVSTITGPAPYEFLPRERGLACCVTGFEPTDILRAVLALVEQVRDGEPRVENQYRRVVRPDGNPAARAVIEEVFEPADSYWRGLGPIAGSGLALRREWEPYRLEPPGPEAPAGPDRGCRCAEVLRGLIHPPQCPLFGRSCIPDSPVGPCMVSSEGSCAAYYKYGAGRGT